jgi:hypothetical protein
MAYMVPGGKVILGITAVLPVKNKSGEKFSCKGSHKMFTPSVISFIASDSANRGERCTMKLLKEDTYGPQKLCKCHVYGNARNGAGDAVG